MSKFSKREHGFADGARVPVFAGLGGESMEFDYDAADPVVRELLEKANDAAKVETCEAIAQVLAQVYDAKRPALVAAQIACGVGMFLTEGVSEQALADRFGISKQAFQQGKMRLMKRLGLRRPTRAMKRNREVYRGSNYRPVRKAVLAESAFTKEP